MYYCIECHQLHAKESYLNEVVFQSGFFNFSGVIHHAGFCGQRLIKKLHNAS
ncbi:DUF3973 domain-containing protein [Paenibacillus sp. P26]|nr:DUF3973 domain-containing protein [Paenibacillus sp. P26]UUZ97216.1 DUF3973 domain-containing protein [Paenibacillus sp. P25]